MGQNNHRAGIWAEISQVVVIANVLITVAAVGSHAAIMKATGTDEFVQFAQVLGRTAPLALAVAVITFLTLRQFAKDDFDFGILLLASAGSLFVATWLANQFGDLRVTEPLRIGSQQSGWGLQAAAEYGLGMVLAYFEAYGTRDFSSSVIVGGALGWTWSRVFERTNGQGDHKSTCDESCEPERLAA